MTFTMTVQEEGEMWAESAQSVVCDITSETFEFTYELPNKLGRGGYRGVQVHPDIWLAIMNYQYHDDLIFLIPEWEHPLQFGVLLSGSTIDEYEGKVGEGYTCVSGSGIQRQMSCKVLQTRHVGVDIQMSPSVLRTFFPTTDGEILPQLRFLTQGNDWQSLIYPEITPAIQGVVQQIINCPYHGVTKRMYLQAKVNETFRGFDQNFEEFFVALVLAWKLNENKTFTFDAQYSNGRRPDNNGLLAFGNGAIKKGSYAVLARGSVGNPGFALVPVTIMKLQFRRCIVAG